MNNRKKGLSSGTEAIAPPPPLSSAGGPRSVPLLFPPRFACPSAPLVLVLSKNKIKQSKQRPRDAVQTEREYKEKKRLKKEQTLQT